MSAAPSTFVNRPNQDAASTRFFRRSTCADAGPSPRADQHMTQNKPCSEAMQELPLWRRNLLFPIDQRTAQLRQCTKSLRSSPLRGGVSREAGSKPIEAAVDTTLAIAANPKRLGARIGITAVLHTWGSTLTHHPALRQGRSHNPWGEANRRAQCEKSACCLRRGGGWKRGKDGGKGPRPFDSCDPRPGGAGCAQAHIGTDLRGGLPFGVVRIPTATDSS
jgi:hypothetical protein